MYGTIEGTGIDILKPAFANRIIANAYSRLWTGGRWWGLPSSPPAGIDLVGHTE